MDYYIKFYAQVNQNTAVQLQRAVEQALLQGMKTLHLLISTPGGSVHDGISLYNLLKALPITVKTYNFGSVDSIGVVIFCAGSDRYSVQHARFLMHPVAMQILANQTMDEPALEEKLKLMRADQSNIANVISSTTNKPVDEMIKLIHARTTLDPNKAIEYGLVTEIKSSIVPSGTNLFSIYDNQPQQQQILQLPFQLPGNPMRGNVTIPEQGFTSIVDSYTILNGY